MEEDYWVRAELFRLLEWKNRCLVQAQHQDKFQDTGSESTTHCKTRILAKFPALPLIHAPQTLGRVRWGQEGI